MSAWLPWSGGFAALGAAAALLRRWRADREDAPARQPPALRAVVNLNLGAARSTLGAAPRRKPGVALVVVTDQGAPELRPSEE